MWIKWFNLSSEYLVPIDNRHCTRHLGISIENGSASLHVAYILVGQDRL